MFTKYWPKSWLPDSRTSQTNQADSEIEVTTAVELPCGHGFATQSAPECRGCRRAGPLWHYGPLCLRSLLQSMPTAATCDQASPDFANPCSSTRSFVVIHAANPFLGTLNHRTRPKANCLHQAAHCPNENPHVPAKRHMPWHQFRHKASSRS